MTKLLSSIFLAKYQRGLIPYFETNLLLNMECDPEYYEEQDAAENQLQPLLRASEQVKQKIKQYLLQAYLKSRHEKIDSRIIKNLDKVKGRLPNDISNMSH